MLTKRWCQNTNYSNFLFKHGRRDCCRAKHSSSSSSVVGFSMDIGLCESYGGRQSSSHPGGLAVVVLGVFHYCTHWLISTRDKANTITTNIIGMYKIRATEFTSNMFANVDHLRKRGEVAWEGMEIVLQTRTFDSFTQSAD